ncbi:MAG: SDR family NAD(P)-dependent oxidoreductase [Aquisalimonadaceae bacterium]
MSNERPVALVTGASVGIGRAIATTLATRGHDLVLAALDRDELRDTEKEVAQHGARCVCLGFDLADVGAVRNVFANALEQAGPINVLVNNAAIPLHKPALEVTEDEWNAVVDVNLRGTFFMCQAMARHLREIKQPGRIVNISSTHGLVALKDRSTYGITKAGLIHMSRMLAIEWAEYDIRVNAVAPATISTPSREEALAASGKREFMVSRIPLGRFGTAEEVAGAVAYLVSPEANFVTGQTIVLDGGLTAV